MRYFLDGIWATIGSTVSSLCPRRNATQGPCYFNCKACLTSGATPKATRKPFSTWQLLRARRKKRNRLDLLRCRQARARLLTESWRDVRRHLPLRQRPRPRGARSTASACARTRRGRPATRRITGRARSPLRCSKKLKRERPTRRRTKPARPWKNSSSAGKRKRKGKPSAKPRAPRATWLRPRTSGGNWNSRRLKHRGHRGRGFRMWIRTTPFPSSVFFASSVSNSSYPKNARTSSSACVRGHFSGRLRSSVAP